MQVDHLVERGRTTAIRGGLSWLALIADLHMRSCKPLTLASKGSI
jgi:hypothetical protein